MAEDDTSVILPTLYEYYTENGIHSGLSDEGPDFRLNGKIIRIFSGSLHYFRVHPVYWRDRLRKCRAAGLNCVATYVPWNLHEPEHLKYCFGQHGGRSDMRWFVDLVGFLNMAKDEDLFVILRPGPYICAEWEFGGLPSWLLRYKDAKIRTSNPKYMLFVDLYFRRLLKLVEPLQFTKGGPIIAVQIENEYGNVKEEGKPIDIAYLEKLKKILKQNGIVELLFTFDTPTAGFDGTLPGVLTTANLKEDCSIELELLKAHQPNKPLMVMEYRTGWFDHYTEKHHEKNVGKFETELEDILMRNASFNLYMMQGGTNWGFYNGANIFGDGTQNEGFQPDTSSYDCDAPISENGDYTDKYLAVQRLTAKYSDLCIRQPSPPEPNFRVAYPEMDIFCALPFDELVQEAPYSRESIKVLPMEQLNINDGNGQSFGYVVYRQEDVICYPYSVLKIEGHVCDTVLVLVDGKLVNKVPESEEDLNGFGFWRLKDSTICLNATNDTYTISTLDLVVENFGRVNYGKSKQFNQFKGLWQGKVFIDDELLKDWTIFPLDFKTDWIRSLVNWLLPTFSPGPCLYQGQLWIDDIDSLKDTYLDLKGWTKGIIIVNGFVLSRYFKFGPQQTVYLPAPFLKVGDNQILLFEHFTPSETLNFCTDPYFETLGDGKILRKLL